MGLLIFALIVFVVAVLVCWAIWYLPLPPSSPAWIKNVMTVIVLIIAALVILAKSGYAWP
jgi:heme A synthase